MSVQLEEQVMSLKDDDITLCEVCYTNEIQPKSQSCDANTVEFNCGHRFCKDCVKAEFNIKLSGSKLELKCMAAGCGKEIDNFDLQRIDSNLLAVKKRATTKKLNRINPNIRYCQNNACLCEI